MPKKDSITNLSGVRLVKMPRKIAWEAEVVIEVVGAMVIDEEAVETGEEEEEEFAMPFRRAIAVVDHRASSLTLEEEEEEEEEVVVDTEAIEVAEVEVEEEEEEECATLTRGESALADPHADFRTKVGRT